jgi:hypothetical protein
MIGRRDYAERRAARIARLEARAAKARAEGHAAISRASSMASVIPFGQPVQAPGHHSRQRDLNYRARIDATFDRGFRSLSEAKEIERRAESAARDDAISSDDPEALTRLRQKLADEESELGEIKAANAVLKRGGSVAEAAALLTTQRDPVRHIEVWRSMGQRTLPTTNVTARIRATKKRIAELEARSVAPIREPERHGDATIEESENRVRIVFPGKPADAVREHLKRAGFHWSPSAGAWQRHASPQAWNAARAVLAQLADTAAE